MGAPSAAAGCRTKSETEPRLGQRLLSRARRAGLTWPLPDALGDAGLEALLFHHAGRASGPTSCPGLGRGYRDLPSAERDAGTALGGVPRVDDGRVRLLLVLRSVSRLGWTAEAHTAQVHIAGERLFVDFAGHTMEVIDGTTGEIRRAEIFVAVLGRRASSMPRRPGARRWRTGSAPTSTH